MAKQKTIPQLEAEKADNERQPTQLRRKRVQHLITRGAAIESVASLTKVLTETEFLRLCGKSLRLAGSQGPAHGGRQRAQQK